MNLPQFKVESKQLSLFTEAQLPERHINQGVYNHGSVRTQVGGKRKRIHYKTTKDYSPIFDKMEAGKLKVDVTEGRVYIKHHGVWIEPYIHDARAIYSSISIINANESWLVLAV